jgi:uncharacterized protein (DUF2236 family)
MLSGPSVLREYGAPWLPTVLGGWAAFTTLVLLDHMRQSISMAMAHRAGFNEFRQLIRGVLIAVFGDTEQVEAQRAAAWTAHDRLRGVGQDGQAWTANDPELTARVFTILIHHLLDAQERLLGRLTDAERDTYCAEAVRTVGHVFGNESFLPVTHAGLGAQYADFIGHSLTVTPQTHEVFQATRMLEIRGVPMECLVAASCRLVEPEVAEIFGIDRSRPAEFPRLEVGRLTDADLLPVACAARDANPVSRPPS